MPRYHCMCMRKLLLPLRMRKWPLRGSYQREELFREEVPVVIPQTPVRRHDVQPPVVTAAVIRSDLVPVEKSFVDHGITPTMLEMDELHLCEA